MVVICYKVKIYQNLFQIHKKKGFSFYKLKLISINLIIAVNNFTIWCIQPQPNYNQQYLNKLKIIKKKNIKSGYALYNM